jgi:hypothetical protein
MHKKYEIDYGTSTDKPIEELEVAIRVKLDRSITPNNDYPYIFLDEKGGLVKPTDEPPFMPPKRGKWVMAWLLPTLLAKAIKETFGVDATPLEVQMTTEV